MTRPNYDETEEMKMTDREFDAIRELMAVLRSDLGTVAKVLAAMIERGFTAKETQFAINEIAKRNTTHRNSDRGETE